MEPEKVNLINTLQLLASPILQKKYNDEVPEACVPDELIAQWFDDFFFPDNEEFIGLFSGEEWKILMSFHECFKGHLSKLPRNYADMENSSVWKNVIKKASVALNMLGWVNVVTKYDD